jgi:phosphomannomutase
MVSFTITYRPLGFKFIGNTALALVEQGFEVPFGYEEAIGFMIRSEIRDKDGVAAAVQTCPTQRYGKDTDRFKAFFAELVASLHREGKTASSFLQELYERYVSIECGIVPRLCQPCVSDTDTSRSVSF